MDMTDITCLLTQKESLHNYYSGKIPDNSSPEQVKQQMLDLMNGSAGYTPEIIAKCDVHVYQPVSFTKIKLSSATLTNDNKVTVKYQAGAVDGELSAEGTYTKNENKFTFAYTNLPEDADLRRVAEKALVSAEYDSYVCTATGLTPSPSETVLLLVL